MASLFDEIDAAGQAAIDLITGEAISLIGMISSDFAAVTDPGRPAQDSRASLALSSGVSSVVKGVRGVAATGTSKTDSNHEALISVQSVSALDWLPKRDDILTASGRRFKISASLTGSDGSIRLLLNEEIAL